MMTTDDMLKLKAVTLYILKQCGELDFIHLFKILYFAERQHYACLLYTSDAADD